jgi:hypothetical protein
MQITTPAAPPVFPSWSAFQTNSHSEPIYSVRIGMACRAHGVFEGETMIWFCVEFHGEFNTMINNHVMKNYRLLRMYSLADTEIIG